MDEPDAVAPVYLIVRFVGGAMEVLGQEQNRHDAVEASQRIADNDSGGNIPPDPPYYIIKADQFR